jgi:hypothetical protein
VYGSNVEFNPEFLDEMSRPSKPKPRRRPPPQQLAAMKVPLEKVFDPNTISNYDENSRAYYGMPMPPPTSDLPLRDDSVQSTDVRESLIDLDASLHGSDLSRFVDMETIRAGPRASTDYNMDEPDFNKPPLSDPAEPFNNRRTQDWKFPSMMDPPASANPEMYRFPFNEGGSTPSSALRQQLLHHPSDPVAAPNYGSDLLVPAAASQANRASAGSLIDLDMSFADPMPELTRPSTANSDAASVSGSDMGMANPFDLERHASLYIPSTNREPSIYVSDDSDFASRIPKDDDLGGIPDLGIVDRMRENGQGLRLDTQSSFTSDEYSESEYLTPQQIVQPRLPATQRSYPAQPLPPPPAPPAMEVMQGQASAEAVKEELRRMAMSLGEHLSHANQYISTLPIRRGNGRPDLSGDMG